MNNTLCLPLVEPGQCRGCAAPLPRRKDGQLHKARVWCGGPCEREIVAEHNWTTARARILRENAVSELGPHCEVCRRPRIALYLALQHGIERCDGELEVNHKAPLVGTYRSWSCLNHRANLEVACHGCHKAITAEQRRARRLAVA